MRVLAVIVLALCASAALAQSTRTGKCQDIAGAYPATLAAKQNCQALMQQEPEMARLLRTDCSNFTVYLYPNCQLAAAKAVCQEYMPCNSKLAQDLSKVTINGTDSEIDLATGSFDVTGVFPGCTLAAAVDLAGFKALPGNAINVLRACGAAPSPTPSQAEATPAPEDEVAETPAPEEAPAETPAPEAAPTPAPSGAATAAVSGAMLALAGAALLL